MKEYDRHIELIDEGLELYEAFKYQKAYPILKEAYKIAPNCLCAMYNYANVLHMLDKSEEACSILKKIIIYPPELAKHHCNELVHVKGFIIDAYYLLFHVLIYWKGFSEEAFSYAYKHLELRKRGIKSAWTKRHIVKEIKEYRQEWESNK